MDDLLILNYMKNKKMEDINIPSEHEEELFKPTNRKETKEPKEIKEEKQVLDDHKAIKIVSNMYHYYMDSICKGEIYSMDKAMEIRLRYSEILSDNITVPEVYIAINALYHDYINLFRLWFGGSAELKIVESAITFWLQDDDYSAECKMMNYFK